MKHAAVGFLTIFLLALGATAQISESDKDRGQATGEQTLLVLRQRATNFQDITGSCDKSDIGKRCLALVKLDAWDKCDISIVQDAGARRSTYECFWSDKDQDRTLAFYVSTAINFHTAALSEYKNAQLAFPTPEKAESSKIAGLVRIVDGQDIVGDLALIHEDDGSTSVGLWIIGAQQKGQWTHQGDEAGKMDMAPPKSSSSSRTISRARDYYERLYDAGGFFRSVNVTNSDGKPAVLRAPNMDYVCFSDDQQSDDFLAFTTMAYDEWYAKAYDSLGQQATFDKQQEASRIMQSIQQDVPYLSFLNDEVLGTFPSELQAYLRQGGRVLNLVVYRKGVNDSGEQDFRWDANKWVLKYLPEDPTAYIKKTETFTFSIEPATLRYGWSDSATISAGTGDTAVTETRNVGSDSGACEKIPLPN